VNRKLRNLLGGNGGGKRRSGSIIDLSGSLDIADVILKNEEGSIGGSEFLSDDDTSGISDTGDDKSDHERDDVDALEKQDSNDLGDENKKSIISLSSDYLGSIKPSIRNTAKQSNPKGSKRAVGLIELGPRMELGLFKIESGISGSKRGGGGEGDILFHEISKLLSLSSIQLLNQRHFAPGVPVHKTPKELSEIAAKKAMAEKRRKEQEKNVARKKAEKESRKRKSSEHSDEEKEDEEIESEEEVDGELHEEEEQEEYRDANDSSDDEEEDEDSDLSPIEVDPDELEESDEEEPQTTRSNNKIASNKEVRFADTRPKKKRKV
jgi:ribosome biogenesis protein SSF1/2